MRNSPRERCVSLGLDPHFFTTMKCILAALVFLATASLHAADWPGFRGADGSGVARDAVQPVTSSDAENVKWKAALPGPGSSSPIVSGQHGYASSTPVTDGERVHVFFGKTGVLAFDFAGKELWRVNVGKESATAAGAQSDVAMKTTRHVLITCLLSASLVGQAGAANGLTGQYFDEYDFTSRILRREMRRFLHCDTR